MPLSVFAIALVLVTLAGFVINFGCVWAASRVVGARAPISRVLLVWAMVMGISVAIVGATAYAPARPLSDWAGVAGLIAMFVVFWRVLRVSWWRGLLAMGAALALMVGSGFAGAGVLRSTLMHAYTVTTGSMAPLLAEGDRFLADVTARPRRWDVVVFRAPDKPGLVYVKRVVGLPGETVEIIDGEVHVDGKPEARPSELSGIRYDAPVTSGSYVLRGQKGAPARLGPDEVFVIGDDAGRSLDSRFWAAGAVRLSDVRGVARLLYSPGAGGVCSMCGTEGRGATIPEGEKSQVRC